VQASNGSGKPPQADISLVKAMISAVLLDLTTAADTSWRAALARTGVHLGAACGGDKLVQCTTDGSIGQLVCVAPGLTPEVVAAMQPSSVSASVCQ
jgi:hypothetical protein